MNLLYLLGPSGAFWSKLENCEKTDAIYKLEKCENTDAIYKLGICLYIHFVNNTCSRLHEVLGFYEFDHFFSVLMIITKKIV